MFSLSFFSERQKNTIMYICILQENRMKASKSFAFLISNPGNDFTTLYNKVTVITTSLHCFTETLC